MLNNRSQLLLNNSTQSTKNIIMLDKEIKFIAKLIVTTISFPFTVFMKGVDNYIELFSTNETIYKIHAAVTIILISAALLYRFFGS